ncbi:spore coat polysaccharide biosynthesis protein SpsC [Sporosarcina newyorkensis 2681]|uniref:Spore coat polysaccharide biosynthesis protein SpsC n=1 Tax=Sporosarcina newyorkensis 2681 TaxID=1027292 RepID=F9DQ84_9BACL|nr:aminotransferase class I/II-fold pyridoxal phosphate-dependent enzyme [Sporosarcina newyorkensis]EGQ27042.1 spore coat polysaccharide biosynthesis protein SpsC [Sporosarcina newyorkensis 2681]
MELDKMLCEENATLLGVLYTINTNTKGTAFIVDQSKILLGVVTDGDVRRALLSGKQLDTKVSEVLQNHYVIGSLGDSYETLLSKTNSKIKILPIVDENKRVVDFFEYRTDITTPVSSPYLKGNELKYVTDAVLSTWISSTGKYIDQFEQEFATFSECDYGVAVSNGTVALHLALATLGIGEGDEVIIPDLTFAATINAVLHANATPVIVDVEKDSWCIDPLEIKKAITKNTKAIIPVHIYGQPCEMDSIMELANQHNLFVVEDCAEAHGATYKGRKVGSFGHIGCFSFFANKIITTGEGGMCVTNDAKQNLKLRQLRDHGMSKEKRYWHEEVGFNYRMTNLQAAIGVAQMEKVNEILDERMSIGSMYSSGLNGMNGFEMQKKLQDREKVVWLYSALIKDNKRDEVLKELKEQGYDARPFFYSLSEMEIYQDYAFSNKNSLEISSEGINLPTYVGISDDVIQNVSKHLERFIDK